jgi:hypothetical protein
MARKLVVLSLVLACPLLSTAADDLMPDGSPPACWQEELLNSSNPKSFPKIVLPDELKAEHVTGTMIKAKLCLNMEGRVIRVLILTGSGSTPLDDFYRTCLEDYIYPPMKKGGQPCESVAYVLFHLILH